MNLFFGIFLILTLFFPLSGMEKKEKGGMVDPGTTPRVGVMLLPGTMTRREQERIRTARFTARVRDFAVSLGKGRKNSLPCRIRMQKNMGHAEIKCDGKSAEILMEEDFSILSARKENLHLLAGWLLLVENGLSPQMVKNKEFYTSFLVTGVARRAFMDVDRRSLPYPDYFPGARTLASHGVFPSLARCLENPGETQWSSVMSLYSEYCELLFVAMLRSRGFDRESFTKILFATALSPEKSQKEHFFDLLRMQKKGKKKGKAGEKLVQLAPEALESWYSAFLRKTLQGPMQPLSAEKWEARYREILSFHAGDIPGAGGYVTIASPHFPEAFKNGKDPDQQLFQILNDLLYLGNLSPLPLREELHRMRRALLQYRRGMKERDLQTLLRSDKRVFLALEKEYRLREFLEEAERKNFSPPLRFQRSLHASLRWEEKKDQNMGKRFAALFAGAESALSGREGGHL